MTEFVSSRTVKPRAFWEVDEVPHPELPKELEIFKDYVAAPTLNGADNFKRQIERWKNAELYRHFGYDDWYLFVVEQMGMSVEWMEFTIASVEIAENPEQFHEILDRLKAKLIAWREQRQKNAL